MLIYSVVLLSVMTAVLIFSWIKAEKLEKQRGQLQEELFKSERDRAVLEARKVEPQNDLENIKQQLKVEIELMSEKMIASSSTKLQEAAEKNLSTILSPLRDKLGEFQKKVEDVYSSESRERFALKEEISRIVQESQRMTTETSGLVKALKGDSRTQGAWGEVTLDRIMESSGLTKGLEYVMQAKDLNLKDENGNNQRPDLIVLLPETKSIVVDSKVSLKDYERFINDESRSKIYLDKFLSSIYKHIDGLSGKQYQNLEGLKTPEFVLMFFPLEAAFAHALQSDKEIFSYAWNKRVVMVSPTTLLATLRTVASMWRIENQNKNAIEIARQAGALYDKFVGLVTDLESVSAHINKAHEVCQEAYTKVGTGKGNLVARVESLKKLGAKTSKQLSLADEEQ